MENNDEKAPVAKMMIVEDLIETLMNLWNKGVDFVDLYVVEEDETQEEEEKTSGVTFAFNKSYMNEEHKDKWEEMFGVQEEVKTNPSESNPEDLA